MNKIYYRNRYKNELIEEKVPGFILIKLLYCSIFTKPLLKLIVANKFMSVLYGKLMKTASSKKKIIKFAKNYEINMNESDKTISEFNSFNDFFIRKLKPDARLIDSDSNSIISPADGKVLIFEDIENSNIFNIKGDKFSVDNIMQNKDITDKFQNYSMVVVRLAPTDYHRFHFPCTCTAKETHEIAGYYYSVSPLALSSIPNIFCQNKRTICHAHNEQIGQFYIIEIGATMVGSVIQTYNPKEIVNKGDEKGYFEFGGSTVILLFKKDSIKFDNDLILNTKEGIETKIKMGERIGSIKIT